MQYDASSPEDYIAQIPDERKGPFTKLRSVILENLPEGYREAMAYGMISYVVPHEIYPPGYHVNPKIPLPFLSIASQKNFIAFYHMGIYADKDLLAWFEQEYPKHCNSRLDMGKSCIRFKKIYEIPYDLIAELLQKMPVHDWISIYENSRKKQG